MIADTYFNRGIAYIQKGEQDNAISDYSKAIELNSDYVIAYYCRGIAHHTKGEVDKAYFRL